MARLRGAAALALLLAAVPPQASAGEILRDQAAPSPALGGEIRYTIYLPDGAASPGATPGTRFPVVYLLHGYNGGQREWFDAGHIHQTLDRLIAEGAIRPVIAVAPEAGISWYVDSAAHGGPGDYATAIVRDLVAAIDSEYPTQPDRAHRAVTGNSMGGHGALRLAFAHPGTFGAAAALSPAIWKPGGVSWADGPMVDTPEERETWYPRTTGPVFDFGVFNAQSPFAMTAAVAALPDPPRIFLASGDDDYFSLQDGTVEIYLDLRAHGLKPELRIADGGHDWKLWRQMVEPLLRFFDAGWQGGG